MLNTAPILVVDDEPAIRRLLRGALERAGHAVIEAASAREALAALDIDKPRLALLDLGLPDRDGLELVPLMKARGVAVLVVSAREATAEKVAALDLGAEDYVTKPFDTEEVLARIRTTLRRAIAADRDVALVIADLVIDLERRRVTRGGGDIHLRPKEYALLAELARQPGKVLTHAYLLRTIWGPAHERDLEYLRVAARGLRLKLEADPASPRLIINEPAVGYRLDDRHNAAA
ncbi:response regulator [Sphingomonas astaxanthinifaciens]|uniref:DNA-binding response regulator n=1 Tax=Sphingomonas astaxanthinifaciens DSM 22298 TaxID=1123267 RepID=A0ABQ5ZB65_9SPHN|nr:response regulator transcription factor [Sphingomonas astaxanthinifaciens]GLR48731.1 DNA-binding response regulator [Sphingomonas astaxanthinifaciens DSM 22298]